MTPKRIQRKRTKGWRMPAATVFVGRPTKFGNPYSLSDYAESTEGRQSCVEDFAKGLQNPSDYGWAERILRHVHELRGKDLACWCPEGQPCHADALLALANSEKVGA